VSTYGTDFPFDFGLALTEEQAQQIPEVKEMIDNPGLAPGMVGAGWRGAQGRPPRGLELHRVRRENGTVYHTACGRSPSP
jgi:hypothetical protein